MVYYSQSLRKMQFIYLFWFCWVFVAALGFTLVVSGGCSSLRCMGFSLQWLLLLWSTGAWAPWLRLAGSRAWAQWLWHMRFSCSEACESFPDQGLNLCPLRWRVHSYPLYHWGSPKMSFLRKQANALTFWTRTSDLNKKCSLKLVRIGQDECIQ